MDIQRKFRIKKRKKMKEVNKLPKLSDLLKDEKVEKKNEKEEKLVDFNFAYLSEKICPHCKNEIEPIIIDPMKFAEFSKRQNKRTVKLLGCPICHILYYKE